MSSVSSLKRMAREVKTRIYDGILIRLAGFFSFSYPSVFKSAKSALLRMTGMKIGCPVFIDSGFQCFYPGNITIADNVSMGHHNRIWAFDKVFIGSYVQTALGLTIIAGSHRLDDYSPMRDQKVILEGENWIGANVTIIGNVTIGKGSVIGAGAVVVNDIPAYSVAVGVPAKCIRKREPAKETLHPFGVYTPAYFEEGNPA